MLVIVISDNGCGFDPANTPTFRSGLKNMRGRIAERGGTIHIQSEPGRGSLIRLLVPLP
jgi:signal transduction histidine kinase